MPIELQVQTKASVLGELVFASVNHHARKAPYFYPQSAIENRQSEIEMRGTEPDTVVVIL